MAWSELYVAVLAGQVRKLFICKIFHCEMIGGIMEFYRVM